MSLTIGITGHRRLDNEKHVRHLLRSTLQDFIEKYKTDKLIAISAMAVGADTVFAEEAKALGIEVAVTLPFDLEEYKKDFTEEDKKYLETFIAEKKIVVVDPAIPRNDEERNNAYLKTGKYIVDRSDIMIAVWNRQPAKGTGGTGDIVAYAELTGKELYIIDTTEPYNYGNYKI